jgi:hypothetical protein
MNEQDARAALIEMGISPNAGLIRNWLRANGAAEEDWNPEPIPEKSGFNPNSESPEAPSYPISSKSRLA